MSRRIPIIASALSKGSICPSNVAVLRRGRSKFERPHSAWGLTGPMTLRDMGDGNTAEKGARPVAHAGRPTRRAAQRPLV